MRRTMWQTLDESWPEYLTHHRDPRNRAMHFAADGVVLATVGAAVLTASPKLALAGLAGGYALVFVGHAIEGSRPMTLSRPIAAAFSNWRMFALACTGRLDRELDALGVGACR